MEERGELRAELRGELLSMVAALQNSGGENERVKGKSKGNCAFEFSAHGRCTLV